MVKLAEFLEAEPETVTEFSTVIEQPSDNTAHDDALDDFLYHSKACGGDGEIVVRKILDSGNPNSSTSFCTRYPVDKFDYYAIQDVIKKRFGGGDYRLFLMGMKNGKRKIIQNQLISIEAEKEVVKSHDSEVVALLREVLARQTPALAAPSPQTMMQQMTEMVTLMNLLRPPERNTLKEFAETMSIMQGLGMMPGGGEDEPSPIWGKLAEALPVLISGFAAKPANRMRPRPVKRKANPQPQPQPQPKPAPEPVTIVQESNKNEEDEMLQIYLNRLYSDYQAGRTAEDMADGVMDATNEVIFNQIITALEKTDWDKPARTVFTDAASLEWLSDVREWLLAHAGLESKFSDRFEAAG